MRARTAGRAATRRSARTANVGTHALKPIDMNAPLPDEKELPLREDTRLLGRILGDVLRAQTGNAGFERVEAIRQTAIRFRRTYGEEAQQARGALSSLLNPLAIGEVVYVVRAFSYFASREYRRGRSSHPTTACLRNGAIAAAA